MFLLIQYTKAKICNILQFYMQMNEYINIFSHNNIWICTYLKYLVIIYVSNFKMEPTTFILTVSLVFGFVFLEHQISNSGRNFTHNQSYTFVLNQLYTSDFFYSTGEMHRHSNVEWKGIYIYRRRSANWSLWQFM